VLPAITGSNLTGNEGYYTEPNGSGNAFNSGEVINFNDFSIYPIVLYVYDNLNLGCGSEQSFELTITSEISCTILASPLSGDIDVPVNTDLTWNLISKATGYRLSIGTSSNDSDILNSYDVGNVLSYNLPLNLPENTQIFVKISPYNEELEVLSCSEERFTTGTYSNSNTKIPNFFSPNSDGVNDYWIVPDPTNSIERILILDRYGKLIEEVKDFSIGWDGTYKNQLLKVDDYWFIIWYKTGLVLRGHFSLLR
jgi:gliding motility-associated-like protein